MFEIFQNLGLKIRAKNTLSLFVKNPVPRSSLRIRECPRCARIRSMLRSSLEHRASAKIQRVSVD